LEILQMKADRLSLERILFAALIVLLLGGGLLVGRHFDGARSPDGNPTVAQPAAESPRFQDWLWERHGLDLLVQVALVFAGTLGVAAILPNISEGTELPVPPAEG
jgi:hypothetical protein